MTDLAGGGEVGHTLSVSRPSWDPPTRPAHSTPNVVVLLADDLGFSDLGCYGGEIDTPNIDGLARRGTQFLDHHATPLCSPSRAALLTGVNAHLAGVGTLAQEDRGFPGYRSELSETVETAGELLRAHGYATFAVGKWHLTPHSAMSSAGDRRSWPLQKGFDRFYGFLDAYTNLHHPHLLHRDNHVLEVDEYPPGYYLTDDLTDQAISMVRNLRAADSTKPFFLYLAHAAAHAPHHAKQIDLSKYLGRYTAGWDKIRKARFASQRARGIWTDETTLPDEPANGGYQVPRWTDLTPEERDRAARLMEVYAAMVDNLDQNVGRLVSFLEDVDEFDNTIFVVTSDNGAAMGGGRSGVDDYVYASGWRSLRPQQEEAIASRSMPPLRTDVGGPRTFPMYALGWAMASNTPFRYFKRTTFAGGHQVPLIVLWPSIDPGVSPLRRQYTHVTDLIPTLIEGLGVTRGVRRGPDALAPLAGRSFLSALSDAAAPSLHREQYQEMIGHRAFRRDSWEAVTLHAPGTSYDEEHWHLFNLADDATQSTDLSSFRLDKVEELSGAWADAARANNVLPLVDGEFGWAPFHDTTARASRDAAVVLTAETHTFDPWIARDLIHERPYSIRVRTDYSAGDEGVLVAHGDQAGGYLLHVRNGRCFYTVNIAGTMHVLDGGLLPHGTVEILIDATLEAAGSWCAELNVNGAHVGRLAHLPNWGPYTPLEGIDIGVDRRSPVDWALYESRGAYAYTGAITSVTYTPGELPPHAAARRFEAARLAALQFQ